MVSKTLKVIFISFPGLFLAFIFALSYLQPPPSDSPLYTHQDLCRDKNYLCIEKYKRQQLLDIQEVLPKLENWIKSKNLIDTQILLDQDTYGNNIFMKAKKQFNQGEDFFKIQRTELFSIDALNSNWFTKNIDENQLKQFQQQINSLDISLWEKTILVLAFHQKHLEESQLKWWFLSQPQSDTSLLTSITPYEYNLLDYDAQIQINETVLFLTNSHKSLRRKIEIKNVSQLQQFSQSEYFYLIYLLQKCGTSKKSSSSRVLVINPLEAFLRDSNEEIYQEEIRKFEKEENGFVEIMRTFKTTGVNEIIEKPINSYMDQIDYFIQQGEVVGGCVQLSLINPETIKIIGKKKLRMLQFLVDQNGESCLQPTMATYSRIYLLGKVLNLKDEKFNECYNKFFVKEFFSKEEEFEYKLQTLSQFCYDPIWEIDPRSEVLNDLKKKGRIVGKKINQAKEYVEIREKNKLDVENGKKIVRFYEQKLDTIARLQIEIGNKIQRMSNEETETQNKNI